MPAPWYLLVEDKVIAGYGTMDTIPESLLHIPHQVDVSGKTILPMAAFFLWMPYQPARKLSDAGCAIALASDYNTGSSPSGNKFSRGIGLYSNAVITEEAINAATINGLLQWNCSTKPIVLL